MWMRVKKVAAGFLELAALQAVSGCAPGPPPPPIPPGLPGMIIGWIVIALLVWCAVLLWKHLSSAKTDKTDHLTNAINSMNKRIVRLEKKMDELERNKEQ